ncbi:pseudouridine synthase [Rudaea sp.]|uniref:pseudouridine synthase n=1 Tax=Rudaea sp. TaxID=2136325 RepID=UPI00321FFCF6
MTAPASRSLLSLKRPQPGDAPDGAPIFEDRLHKVLANAGLGSRRMLEQRIQNGEIRVNTKVAEIGSSVRAGDRIEIDNKIFVVVNDTAEHAKVLIYNKPEGVVATREDPEGRPTIFEQLPQIKGARWISVGRLDINTTGLLLLTTDGALAHALMHPSTEIEREYVCRVHGEVPDEVLEKLKAGIDLDDGPARFDELAVISRGDSHSWFRVMLKEGRNREVRRMWESQGLMVSRLKRIRYGNVELPRGLLRGQSETLDEDTVKALRSLVGAGDPEPSLTLQPVINQRRAKSSNEYRPSPQSQQAWSGAHADEARELRAFDRIRDDGPFRPGAKRNDKRKNKGKGPGKGPRGGGQNAGQPGARQNPPRRGKGRGAAQTQIGVYQPPARSWFAGDDKPQRGNRQRPGGQGQNAGRGQRDAGAMHQNRNPFAQSEGGAQPGNRFKPKRDNNRPRGGNQGNFGAQGQRPFRQDEALPRDDIGNRLHPSEGRRGGGGGRRR